MTNNEKWPDRVYSRVLTRIEETLAGALAHIQSYIHAAETTKDKLAGEKEQFAWKAARLIEKSYGA